MTSKLIATHDHSVLEMCHSGSNFIVFDCLGSHGSNVGPGAGEVPYTAGLGVAGSRANRVIDVTLYALEEGVNGFRVLSPNPLLKL